MKNMNKRDNIIFFVGLIMLVLSLIIGLTALYYWIWTWTAISLVVKIICTCIITFVVCFIGLSVWAGTT